MATDTFILVVAYIIIVPYVKVSKASDSLSLPQSLTDGNTLMSQGGTFELGFFSPGNSKNRYLGIWYKNIPVQTVVWVANRDNPINGSSGVLQVNSTGNLVLTQNGSVVWHTNRNSHKQAQNPVVVLLESGNLVVRNEGDANKENYLWQSFDFPSDTSLPKMKLGRNIKLGLDWKLTSWNSADDPSPGLYSWVLELYNYPEFYLMKETEKFYRVGPWNGIHFSGLPDQSLNSIFNFALVSNKDEVSYSYSLKNDSVYSIIVLNQSRLYRYVWVKGDENWRIYNSQPLYFCDTYGLCGAYGNCMSNQTQVCQCLKGFSPKSKQAWSSSDWSQGCVRNKPLSCNGKDKDGFVKFEGLKVPDTTHTWLNESIGLEECRQTCLSICSCMAYTNSDIRGEGSGCVMWFGDLIDIKQFQTGGQDLYIRISASDVEVDTKVYRRKKNVTSIVAATIGSVCGVLLLSTYILCRVRRNTTERTLEEVEDLDLSLFNLQAIATATKNFSEENKLGEGGFGPVYWGKLTNGQQIAVKRLSSFSGQGRTEFLNEVKVIAKLQHRNLVNLLGCCIHGEERILVYECLANSSLDYFIFDDNKGKFLEWPQRFHIICGIARGLTYLHQDSRLRIIHRDLKASNVLLDEHLNPKISDFGLARTFGGDQIEGNTNRIVGTYGYMAPEYAVDGYFSVKSDVFSLGILMLEVICGKRNKAYYYTDTTLNLVGQAWTLWKEDKALELIDSNLRDSYVLSEVLRCMHVSLLCVQQHPDDRPTMESVILMLGSEMQLVEPKEPGFISKNVSSELGLHTNLTDRSLSKEMTISLLDPR